MPALPPAAAGDPDAAPLFTPSPALPETPPDLPDITLSPTPLSRSPLAAMYRGWERTGRYDVFVKVQRASGDPVAMERFRREAAVMGRLRHPNIVTLYRFYDGDPAALVMEYVPGPTLAALVAADGWLPPLRAAEIIEGVAAALDCAHAQGIVHRDVKPANILLPRRGPARLTDFGVAHIEGDAPLTVMGDILGTIEYASPEQVRGHEPPDTRSDVYALAAVAYFALTGTPPFRAADNTTQAQLSVMHRQVHADPAPLRFHRKDLAPDVEQVVLRGLAKAPDARYQSAGQMAAALRAAVEAREGAPEQGAIARSSRRTGALAGALAGGTLLLLAAIGLPRSGYFAPHSSPALPSEEAWRIPVPAPLPTAPLPTNTTFAPPKLPKAAKTVGSGLAPALPKLAPALLTKPQAAITPKKTHPKKILVARRLPAGLPPAIETALARPARPQPVSQKPKRGPRTPNNGGTGKEPAGSGGYPKQAWLHVYANQSIIPPGQTPRMAGIPAQAVYVDGRPFPALAAGRWAALPAGKHTLSYFPNAASGFSPHAGIPITLMPGAHVSRQVLLPRMTNFSPTAAPCAAAAPVAAPQVAAPQVAAPQVAAPRVAAHEVGWFSVSGWIASPDPKPELTRSPAAWVKVDGQAVAALAAGGWAELTAGHHVVTFQPEPGLGVGPKTWAIDLLPKARLQQQVPLPAEPLPDIPPHLRNP